MCTLYTESQNMVAMATSPMCKVSAISAFCWPTTQTPFLAKCLDAIVLTKPVIAILIPKLVAMATTVRHSISTIFSSDSLTLNTHPYDQTGVTSYHTSKVITQQRPYSQLWQIASQNWLPWQRPSAPLDFHLTCDSLGPPKPTTQTAS